MKKIFLLSLCLVSYINAAALYNGKPIDQKVFCTGMNNAMPGLADAVGSYYSIVKNQKLSCETIPNLVITGSLAEDPLYKELLLMHFVSQKCPNKIDTEKLISSAIERKAVTKTKFDLILKENGIEDLNKACN